MRVVNVKELKAHLSAYLREATRGETFLVTDRSRVVASLGPPAPPGDAKGTPDLVARLLALGARPPLRERRSSDYSRSSPGPRLDAARISDLLDWVRNESR